MSYNITYSKDANKYLNEIPLKHAKLVEEKIRECLMANPKGKTHHCNIKLIKGTNPKKYRFHISMTYTLIYTIDEENKSVFVTHAMGINQAHSKYGIVWDNNSFFFEQSISILTPREKKVNLVKYCPEVFGSDD